MVEFVGDFETVQDFNDKDSERVWLWAIRPATDEKESEKTKIGYSIESYIDETFELPYKNNTIFHHNLEFDCAFIIPELERRGFKWVHKKPRDVENGEYSANMVIGGSIYSLTYCQNNKRIIIRDSLKLFRMSERRLAEDYKLDTCKGEIDYTKPRNYDYIPTTEEIDYIKNDVYIIAKILCDFRKEGFNKNTLASSSFCEFLKCSFSSKDKPFNERFAMNNFKNFHRISKEQDADIRQAYHGGVCILNQDYIEKDIEEGVVYDCNSMFPWAMYNCKMPYGEPLHGHGEPKLNKTYDLFVVKIRISFKLKENKLPVIPNRRKQVLHLRYDEYIDDTKGNIIEIWTTSVELRLILDSYEFDYFEYLEYYLFKSKKGGFFKPFIDKFMNLKEEAKENNNASLYIFAKTILNSLYGKMGTRQYIPIVQPIINDGVLTTHVESGEINEPFYVPLSAFITAYAKNKLFAAIYANWDRFIYCDTDSIHLTGKEPPEGITIDDKLLGAWKKENEFKRARYLAKKTYIEEKYDDELIVRCAGLPYTSVEHINFDNFHFGLTIPKLIAVRVKNGKRIVEDAHSFVDKRKESL